MLSSTSYGERFAVMSSKKAVEPIPVRQSETFISRIEEGSWPNCRFRSAPNLASFATDGQEPVIRPDRRRMYLRGPKTLPLGRVSEKTPVVVLTEQVVAAVLLGRRIPGVGACGNAGGQRNGPAAMRTQQRAESIPDSLRASVAMAFRFLLESSRHTGPLRGK